ncbi:uncharacterized protein LOC112095139, partial [Morus notabilis]|uniref:uncharacterized protein LOC112095139 n=1 Tax=Morus notabilis TaxID=981085 RepID=UPI000CED23AA
IQDQVYDEKQNTVTIKVVCCCDPEKMKQKILCKGKAVIKSIEIKVHKKKEKEDKASNTEDKDKKNADETKDKNQQTNLPPRPVQLVPCVPFVPVCPVPGAGPFRRTCCRECYEGRVGGPCFEGYDNNWAAGPFRRTCCRECNEGRVGGPCFEGYENNSGPVPSSSQCDCYWRRPVVCDSYGGGNIYFHPPQEQCSDPDAGCQIM